MLNSAAFRSKTTRAPAGSPWRGKPSRDKGLMHGRSLRYRRAYETSRNTNWARSRLSRRGRKWQRSQSREIV